MVDVVSFDLDGTLVDTAAEIAEAVNVTLLDFGFPSQALPAIAALIGDGAHALMRRLIARLIDEAQGPAMGVDINAVHSRLDYHYARTAGTTCRPYAGCRDALDRLRAAGVRLVCTTNKEYAHAQSVLDAMRLADAFEFVVGGDSLPVRKPHAGMFGHVCARLDVAPTRVAHVGDSQIDVEAARNAGVAAWAVPWGYNAGRRIADAGPDLLFDSLPAIATHVLTGLSADINCP